MGKKGLAAVIACAAALSMAVCAWLALRLCQGNATPEHTLLAAIDLSDIAYDSTVLYRSHGGSHGDGTTLAVYHGIDAADMAPRLSRWSTYAPDCAAACFLYGGSRDGMYYQSYLPEEISPNVGHIENGSYRFVDRQSGNDHATEADMLSVYTRSSANFILAVWDMDAETLYILAYDS